MANHDEQKRSALIDRLARKARAKGEAGAPTGADRFLRQYYRDISADDLNATPEKDLLGGAMSAWKLLRTRKPDEAKINVFNPDPDRDGWSCPHTVVEIVNDDMPFLVDSVTAELNRRNLTVFLIIHPVIRVERTSSGKLADFSDPAAADGNAESVMHIEINEQTLPETLDHLRERLSNVLQDVRNAVDDWRAMRVRGADIVAELDSAPPPLPGAMIEVTKAFMRWVEDDNFTFLGYREHQYKGGPDNTTVRTVPDSGLGVLRRESTMIFEGMHDGATLGPDTASFVHRPELITFSKSNGRSAVHRAVHLDTIGIKIFNADGEVVGERLFVGLYTSAVYNQGVHDIPVLRQKVDYVVERGGFSPVSHFGKALQHILQTLPRDDLFQFAEDELFETAIGILRLQERQRVALFSRHDPFGRYHSCLIFMPRERYTTQLREQMQRVVEEGFGGRVTVFYVQVSDSVLARLQFIVKTTPGETAPQSLEEIEANLADAGRDWRDDLSHALTTAHGEARGLDLFRAFADAFPVSYRERYDVDKAVADIEKILKVMVTHEITMDLYATGSANRNELRFKVYHPTQLPLSDVLPMLEAMGLKVVGEVSNPIEPLETDIAVWIHDFRMVTRGGEVVDLNKIKANFEALFAGVWHGEIENDGFNRLVIHPGLAPRQITVLRAYCKFLRQAAIPFSQSYMEETLAGNPGITRDLVELFEVLFDPADQEKATARTNRLRRHIENAFEDVQNLDEDRILRRYLNVIDSTLRTNHFQPDADGAPKPYVSFKIDSRAIEELPLPRPLVEIFVYSARVEAIHLRGGKVARGGIRWSDRREDFRTEILGLMKAQMTKNAVIVPVGAKGGFVVKRPPVDGGREALQEEGIACYRTLMSGMLDITDKLKPGELVHPENVVRRDEDDAYLVVAADKGTATFSDIANGIAQDYDFWLDDAFASGGSAGYDHKKIGITARGAWESVKRHFREIDIDTQTTDFTCVGVGDMGGDVFGNGMLLSEHIKLLGAFNHLHIFVDPDPDPATGFEERKRLFDLPRSSWTDYDAKLISKGGGVFDRKAKSIKVTPQMRAAFDMSDKESVTPTELIRSMLAAPVDLMWLGGIGTYVKSRDESHADVGDRVNDSLRLDAGELRCKVVGEGANLGATQLGRIEYALGGGRINPDFIDNSAGVSCSDHEVNIKILLGEVMAAEQITRKQRDRLLVRMTEELANHVLMDNYRQSMTLTHCEAQSFALIDESMRFLKHLERTGEIDRQVEFLPDDETLAERRAAGRGFTRPELAVLLAYSKLSLYDQILDSDVPDDPFLAQDVGLYFPKPIRERYGDFIPGHRLRREISATYITNSLINRTGPTFVNEMQNRTGAAPAEIVKAYLVTRQIFGLYGLWARIEALDNKAPAALQTEMNLEILQLIRRGTLWMLRNSPQPLDLSRAVDRFAPGIGELTGTLDNHLSTELRTAIQGAADELIARGAPKDLARQIASLDILFSGCDIVRISVGGGYPVDDVARVYFAIGEKFGLDWLRGAAESLSADTEWQVMAVSAIVDDLYAQQTAIATKVVDESGGGAAADAVIDAWMSANSHRVGRARSIVGELRSSGSVDLAMLAVANREIRGLLTR